MFKKVLLPALLVVALSAAALVWVWLSEGGETGSSGLKLILRARQAEFELGRPMRFEILAVNRTFRRVSRECHDVPWGTCEIRGPDGDVVPYVDPGLWMSHFVHLDAFPPLSGGHSWDIDVAAEYSITKEGEYAIKVRKPADDLCDSNTIRFTVKGGAVFVGDEVLFAVRKALPPRWHAERYPSVEFEKVSIPGRSEAESVVVAVSGGGKRDNRIDLYLSKTEAPERPTLRPGERRSLFLGKDHRGCFYADVYKKTDETWPGHAQALREALGLRGE
jgi:hypothetical protein